MKSFFASRRAGLSTRSLALIAGLSLTTTLFLVSQSSGLYAEDVSTADDGGFGKHDALVPHFLLGLVHAPEVHQELKLTADQVKSLEALFKEIDAAWFPARNLPYDKQRPIINGLEQRVRRWFVENTSAAQQKRLQQLEYYAQGNRFLLREDVGKRIGLAESQQDRLAEHASASQSLERQLARTKFGDPSIESLQSQLATKTREERAAFSKIIRDAERTKIKEMLGPPFDPSGLSRIYAMAPEFGSAEHWINSSPITMEELRGKVVIVHFYAFQCHNCHANFDIYRRWYEKYSDDDVVVIGVQTPETSRERDPDAVKEAAADKALKFPIQIDLASETWAAWGNTMWPTVYVVDKNGYIRHWWSGELNWKGATADETIEKVVDRLTSES